MQRPAQTRADAVVDGELPALLSRLTVAVHVVADFGTPSEARVAKLGMRRSLPCGTASCRAVVAQLDQGPGAGLKPA
jgi:hypothetical protein